MLIPEQLETEIYGMLSLIAIHIPKALSRKVWMVLPVQEIIRRTDDRACDGRIPDIIPARRQRRIRNAAAIAGTFVKSESPFQDA